jgi:hypothetical protein
MRNQKLKREKNLSGREWQKLNVNRSGQVSKQETYLVTVLVFAPLIVDIIEFNG